MKGKRFLFIIGILLFVAAIIGGGWTYLHRTKKVANQAKSTDSTQSPTTPITPTNPNTPPTPQSSFNKGLYPTDKAGSIWWVVSKTRPLNPLKYAPDDLVLVGNGQYMRQEPAAALKKMIADAKVKGLNLQALSGYRSYDTQVSVYNQEVAKYGQAVADTQSAKPGTSEHQTGLAVDVGGGGCGIEDCFGNTAEGKWVAANGYQYGFIVRYVPGKESITGYRAEPWHIRYIGTLLSQEMRKQNIVTLEEFFGL